MSIKNAIEARSLLKKYDDKAIIQNCDFEVKVGEIYGLLGINGAGKTTILKMILGLVSRDSGDIQILDKDIDKERKFIKKNIGVLIEEPIFYEHLSAEKNIQIHLEYMGVKGGDINEILSSVNLANEYEKCVSKFSYGMRQRLAVARAISHEPKILILDEPFNGMDPVGRVEVGKLLKAISRVKNVTIIFTSHIISEIEKVSNRVGILSGGKVKKEINLSDADQGSRKKLEDIFFETILEGGKNEISDEIRTEKK